MTNNKKVKNAKPCFYNNIQFKSRLEMYCYKYFLNKGVKLQYEPIQYTIVDGFKPNTKIYTPSNRKGKKVLKLNTSKIRPITYTPDFVLETPSTLVFIETKGRPNDVYPLKKKLFLRIIDTMPMKMKKQCWFFEPHNQSQIEETYNIIKFEILK